MWDQAGVQDWAGTQTNSGVWDQANTEPNQASMGLG